ncbi:inositol polyphosphate kinase domain-containing protein [Ditylenchus destructor]|uniref:Kinase n=1 Tax=Ditylenchus destructor TaxID=166010 RepID=A0AAD4N3I9_9BILA|nr:inositol polyphosphate kinase domain-containing protein [Ditylenchus destructor]
MDINDKLPENLEWYKDQIAGHHPSVIRNGLRQIGIIKERGSILILKLVQEGVRGEREVALYEKCKAEGSELNGNASKKSLVYELRQFLPHYYGRRHIRIGTKVNEFIELEDISSPFKKPCIMDIKVGRITYDPEATEAKKLAETTRAPSQAIIGFRVLGYRVHSDISGKEFMTKDRVWGRQLKENEIQGAFEEYLQMRESNDDKIKIIDQFMIHLEKLCRWFETQEIAHFYASSLLLVYEGHSKLKPNVDLRMIDFSHVFMVESGKDQNYLYGLNNVCKTLTDIRNGLDTLNKSHNYLIDTQ